jgi:hypothetical protein
MRENCNGAAVCRVDSSKNAKAVGRWDRSVTARSDGTALELKLAPENGCTVIFNIMCDRDATSDALSFLEETGYCNIRYLFSSLIDRLTKLYLDSSGIRIKHARVKMCR